MASGASELPLQNASLTSCSIFNDLSVPTWRGLTRVIYRAEIFKPSEVLQKLSLVVLPWVMAILSPDEICSIRSQGMSLGLWMSTS